MSPFVCPGGREQHPHGGGEGGGRPGACSLPDGLAEANPLPPPASPEHASGAGEDGA